MRSAGHHHVGLPESPISGCIAHRVAVLFDNSTEPCLSHRRGNAVRCAEAELRRFGRIEARVEKGRQSIRSEEHTSELQSLMPSSYAVFCLKTKSLATISQRYA